MAVTAAPLNTPTLKDSKGNDLEAGDYVQFCEGDKFAGQISEVKQIRTGAFRRILTSVPESLGWVAAERVFKIEPPAETFEYREYAAPLSVKVQPIDGGEPVTGIAISENAKMVRVIMSDNSTPSIPKNRIVEWLGEHIPGVEPASSSAIGDEAAPTAQHEFQASLRRLIIRTDGGTQNRINIQRDVVERYVLAVQSGKILPPVQVLLDTDGNYWLWDGFHRLDAYRELQIEQIEAIVGYGSVEDARWLSYSANITHGLQRTREEMQRVVCSALKHAKSGKLSDGAIADHCGVSPGMVGAWRLRLEDRGEIEPQTKRLVTRNGKTYEQDVSKIGKRKKPTIDDLRAKYEPWGDVERIWETIYEFDFRQRGKLIANFRDTQNGLDRFEEITSRIKPLAELPIGTASCLICQHRVPGDSVGESRCGAKSLTLVGETDWARSNNGDCRLFTPYQDAMLPPSDEFVPEGIGPAAPATTAKLASKPASNPLHSSESNEHYTPASIADASRDLMGGVIGIDLYSSEKANQIIRAERFLTIDSSPLGGDERFASAFCNPPGGKNASGRSMQAEGWDVLYNGYLDGRWEEAIFVAFSIEVIAKRPVILQFPCCFTHKEASSEVVNGMGRIKFLDQDLNPQDSPTHANLLVYLPKRRSAVLMDEARIQDFYDRFEAFGATGLFGQK